MVLLCALFKREKIRIINMAVSIGGFFDYPAVYGKLGNGLVNFSTGCVLWIHSYSLSIVSDYASMCFIISKIIIFVYKFANKKPHFNQNIQAWNGWEYR